MFNSKYFRILLLYLILIGIIPILIIAAFSYRKSIDIVESNIKIANENALTQLQLNFEEDLKYIQNYYTTIALQKDFQEFLAEDKASTDYYTKMDMQKMLNGSKLFIDLVESINFISFDNRNYVSNRSIGELDSTYRDFINKEILYSSYNTAVKKDIYWNSNFFDDDSAPLGLKKFSLVISLPLNNNNKNGVLIVSLSEYQIKNLITNNNKEMNLVITDANNNVIFHKDENFIGDTIETTLKELDHTHLIKKTSLYNGFSYYMYYSNNNIYKELSSITYATFILCFALTICVFVVGFISSRKLHRPISNIYREFYLATESQENELSRGAIDELSYLSTSLETFISRSNLMNLKLSMFEDQMEEMFFNELLYSINNAPDIKEKASFLNISQKFVNMIVFSIEIDESANNPVFNQNFLIIAIKSIVEESIPKKKRLKSVILNGKLVTLTGSSNNVESFIDETYDYVKLIMCEVRERHNVNLFIGISSTFNLIEDTNLAYEESINALLHRQINKDKNIDENIYIFNKLYLSKNKMQKYPKYEISLLITSINESNTDNINFALDTVLTLIYDHKKLKNDYELFFTRLLADIISVIDNYEEDYSMLVDYNKVYTRIINYIDDKTKVREIIVADLINPIMRVIESSIYVSQRAISDKIIEIIHKEYDTDLTIEECAKRLNYHHTYIWRAMKSNLNTTFSEYLLSYRHEVAKKLLKETRITINEISDNLRFSNPQNFIRSFKKRENMTPGKYREEHL